MIPPDCHSNAFSEIYGTSTHAVNLNTSDVAFNNHPGGVNLGGLRPGWRPWKKANGCNAKAGETCKTTGETSFWLNLPGTNGSPAVSEAYYDRPKWTAPDWYNPGDKTYRVYYLSGIGNYSCEYTCPYAQTGRLVHHRGCVFSIRPRCDRLLLAQNVTVLPNGTFDISRASLHWFAPRRRASFYTDRATTVRPFMPPEASFAGWEGGEPYSSPSYGDWRYNPEIAAHRSSYNPDDEGQTIHEDLRLLEEGYTPAEIRPIDWRNWDEPEDGVMLYKITRKERTDPWYTLYWQEDPLCAPEHFSTDRLYAGLQGTDAYPGFHAAILKEAASNADIWNYWDPDAENYLPCFRQGDAFDLRLYCQTYYYRVWRIDVDSATGRETKIKVGRFYFNTLVRAKIRQIAPVPPAPLQ